MEMLTTNEAAKIYGKTPRHYRKLAEIGVIQAEKFGGVWFLSPNDVKVHVEEMEKLGSQKHAIRRNEETQ